MLAGPRAVLEALKTADRARGPRASRLDALFLDAALARSETGRRVEEAAARAGLRVELRAARELDALAGELRHQGVVALAGEYRYTPLERILAEAKAPPLLVALDQVTDPHNFGAIVRTAVALGVDGLITLERRAAPVSGVVVRTSAGATEHARIAQVTNLARTLAALADDPGLAIVGLDAEGEVDVSALPPAPEGRVLVVGSEGHGLRRLVRERCGVLARIPLAGPVESLNASVAAAVAMYEAARQRR